MAVDFESAIVEVNSFGRYQLFYATLLGIPSIFAGAFIGCSHVFVSATPDHWCAVPELIEKGVPLHIRKNMSIPLIAQNDILQYSKCEMYKVNYTDITQIGENWPHNDSSWPTQKCQYGWEYDTTYYDVTLVTQFNTVCDNNWWPSFANSLFYCGGLLGLILFGWISDNYGRRSAFFINLLLAVVFPIASAFSTSYEIYALMRFLIGLTFPAIYQISFVMVMEVTCSKYRTAFGMVYNLMWGVAFALLGLIAYLTRNWFSLTLATSVPFTTLLVYWWLLPESPRWLASQNKLNEAEAVLQKIAKVNKKIIPPNLLLQNEIDGDKLQTQTVNPMKLWLTPNLRKKTILLSIIWWIVNIVYWSLSYLSVNMNINDYLAFSLSGLVEIPSCLVAWYAMEKWGRRWTILITMSLVGACCVANGFVPEDLLILSVCIPIVGKFGITAAFAVLYIFTGELMPTVARNTGLGVCYLFASSGLIAFPYITYLIVYSKVLPFLILGILSFIGGFIACILPETLDKVLPQTLEEGETFGKDMMIIRCYPHCNCNPR